MKYRTLVVDPPWSYDNKATRGAADNHYETASVMEMPDSLPALEDSHLYLWATNAFLRDAFILMEKWDFAYKTLITWVKARGVLDEDPYRNVPKGEEWRLTPGFENYQVSNFGGVKRRDGQILKAVPHNQGYLKVSLGEGNDRLVHRLVAEAFLGSPPADGKWQVNHINGVKTNNLISNLEWVTPRENMQHGVDIGKIGRPGNGTSRTALWRHKQRAQIGLGNFFRNNTEHVLFGVRGKLPTQRKDVPTAFVAPRTKHSQKPDAFYSIVESMSPGPYLDVFARRCRLGWKAWGNEWFPTEISIANGNGS